MFVLLFSLHRLPKSDLRYQIWQFWFKICKKIKLTCQKFQLVLLWYFEVRSLNNKNGYNLNSVMNCGMGRSIPLANLEHDQKFDAALVERLAKVIEVLPNLED